jgi:DNA-binding PadR family transcriptional regulator
MAAGFRPLRHDDDGLGRWSDPPLLVLASLADGPKHGYAITQDVADQTGVRLGPGTLYGAIGRLEERGLIEALRPEQRRRPYRLTAAGEEVLAGTARQMRQVADLGLARLAAARATS